MGDFNVTAIQSQQELQRFMYFILRDMQALEKMLHDEWFETDTIRIGAEQEMCLVNKYWKPANVNLEALNLIDNEWFTTELASFNLETGVPPQVFTGKAISSVHTLLKSMLNEAFEKLKPLDARIILTGILPTIRKFDVEISNITPIPRYLALMNALKELRGELFELRISGGMDELNVKQESAMLEACNTSFQVHLQVRPDDFVKKYNIAQAMAGPIMAIAANSPLLFGRRLWKETRIALFQQSIDVRTVNEHFRERSPRVTFGTHWLKDSILDIYREDIARFKVILRTEIDEDVFEKLSQGITPRLRALNIHNSTVYRWNRPCYGISPNGKPHLRIENRILPSGPSLPDEVANAAFWLGLMNGFEDECADITKEMDFDEAKSNFFAAACYGMESQFSWTNHKKLSPRKLILDQLLPIAHHGLKKADIDPDDANYYLGIIEERAKTRKNGAQWMLQSYSSLAKKGLMREEISVALTASIFAHQFEGIPVHLWEDANDDNLDYEPSQLLVEEFMSTDLITVQEDDILELVTHLINWRKIRHIPVEDKEGNLVGLLTARTLLRRLSQFPYNPEINHLTVGEIMVRDPMTTTPEDKITYAMEVMQKNKIGCLPVLKNQKLVGIITEADFLNITSSLIKRLSQKNGKAI